MPALKGSLTYARFFVEGEPPDDLRDRYLRTIRLRAMKPLEPDDEANERSGWCRVGEPFETELDYEDVFYNEYINLSFRTDRWVIPGPLMRRRLREAETAYLARKGRERVSRKERAELKEMVARKLRRELAPTTRASDLSWSLQDGIVRFFSHAARSGAAMTELFQKTFDLKLVPEAPYTLAARLGLTRAQESAWAALEPTTLEGAAEHALERRGA
jgi:recombination associated protein RdgC